MFTGDVNIAAGTVATFAGGTGFTGTNATLGNGAQLNWNQNGTLAGKAFTFGSNAYIYVGPNNSLTLDNATTATGDVELYSGVAGASITNQGTINHTSGTGYLFANTFTNQGTINVGPSGYLYLGSTAAGYSFANPAGARINVTGGTANLQSALANAGIINVPSGILVAGANLTNGPTGTITGAGTINGNLTLAGGTVSPGNGIGTLTIASGNLVVGGSATLNMELGGTAADQILIQNPTGAIDLGAGLLTLNLSLLGVPTGSTYNLISITGGSGFTGYLAGLPLSGNTITASYFGIPHTFSVQHLATGASLGFTAVPEPDTVALLAAGLLVVAGAGWRRRRRAA